MHFTLINYKHSDFSTVVSTAPAGILATVCGLEAFSLRAQRFRSQSKAKSTELSINDKR